MMSTFLATVLLPGVMAAGGDALEVHVLSLEESRHRQADPSRKDPHPSRSSCTLTLLLKGQPVVEATHWGHLQITTAVDDKGNDLRPDPRETGSPAFQDFVELHRDQMWFFEEKKPQDQIKVEVPLKTSPRSAQVLAKLEGSLKVAATRTKEVVTPPVSGLAGKAVSDPALQAAEVSLKVTKVKGTAAELIQLRVEDPRNALLEMDLVDGAGQEVSNGKMSFGTGSWKDVTFMGEKPLPAGARLKLKVAVERKETVVPIHLEGVALP